MHEYLELKNAGLTDQQITMLRNTGATHAAILLEAKRMARWPRCECGGVAVEDVALEA
jgi:hypothetical protein